MIGGRRGGHCGWEYMRAGHYVSTLITLANSEALAFDVALAWKILMTCIRPPNTGWLHAGKAQARSSRTKGDAALWFCF